MGIPTTITDLSTIASANSPAGSDNVGGNIDDYFRAHAAILKSQFAQGADLASAATLPIPADGTYFNVTGTTTILQFADLWKGKIVVLRFMDVLTLTHSASLVMPTAADVTTAADDVAIFVNVDTNIWRCVSYPALKQNVGDYATNTALAAKVSKTGDTMTGRLNAVSFGATGTTSPTAQGSYMGWNDQSGSGKTRFVNNPGAGTGGFSFDCVNNANTVVTGSMALTAAGILSTSVQGTLWGSSNFDPSSKWSTSDHGVCSNISNWVRMRWQNNRLYYNIDNSIELPIVTDTDVAPIMAAQSAGAVGSTAFLWCPVAASPGQAASGSDLRWAGVTATGMVYSDSNYPTGSWRCLGYTNGPGATLFLRYA